MGPIHSDLLRAAGLVAMLLVGGIAFPGALGAHTPQLPSNPPNPYLVVGYILSPSKTPVSGSTVWVNDTTQGATWTPLTGVTDSSGYYQVDLSGGTPSYANGDLITVQTSYLGLVASNTTNVNEASFNGYSWCNDTLKIAPLKVSLAVHPSSVWVGQVANLTAPVSGGVAPYQFNWTFGDASARVITHPQNYTHHTYAAPGSYVAQVTANSTISGNVTASQTVVVSAAPTVALTYQPASPQAGAGSWVTFTSTLSIVGRGWAYFFVFGDGTSSGLLAPGIHNIRHTYASPGTYTTNVTAWNVSTGYRVDSPVVHVPVAIGLVAGLQVATGTPTEVGIPSTFTASATGSTSPVAYSFAFGDGTSTGPQATTVANHTYSTAANVSATVHETNSSGASASAVVALEVLRHVGLTFAASVLSGASPLQVVFQAQGWAGRVGTGYLYSFRLGDNTNYTGNTSGVTVTTYLRAGTYTASAMVTDAFGVSAWENLTVSVTGPAPLVVSASGTPLTAPAGTTFDFTGSASGGVAPYVFTWTFGDGSGILTGENLSHEYLQPGTYTARLNVTDSDHPVELGSAQVVLHVEPGVPLSISLSGPRGGTVGEALSFELNMTGGIPPYGGIFLFADGSGGAAISPTSLNSLVQPHIFTSGGTYLVTVIVNDSNPLGASSQTAQLSVVIHASPPPPNGGLSQYLPGGTIFPLLLLLVVIAVAVFLILAFTKRRKKEESEARHAILGGTPIASSAVPVAPVLPPDAQPPPPPPPPVDWDEVGTEPPSGFQEGSGGQAP